MADFRLGTFRPAPVVVYPIQVHKPANYRKNLTMKRVFLTLALLSVLGLEQAHGAIVTSLFNTGVDAFGAVLADGTVGDPHYLLITVPGGSSAIRVKTSVSGFPVPPWLADNTLSTWIGPNNGADLVSPPGSYIYRTTFDLTGFDESTASITGQWATDNNATDMLINGNSTGNTTAFAGFTAWTPFTISSGFVAGINVLDFLVFNGDSSPNPTGLRVEMTGTADAVDAAAVPEPISLVVWSLLGSLAVGLGWYRRRKVA